MSQPYWVEVTWSWDEMNFFLFFAFWDHFEPFGALSKYFLGWVGVRILFWVLCISTNIFCFLRFALFSILPFLIGDNPFLKRGQPHLKRDQPLLKRGGPLLWKGCTPNTMSPNYMQSRLIPFTIGVNPFCKKGQPQSQRGLTPYAKGVNPFRKRGQPQSQKGLTPIEKGIHPFHKAG